MESRKVMSSKAFLKPEEFFLELMPASQSKLLNSYVSATNPMPIAEVVKSSERGKVILQSMLDKGICTCSEELTKDGSKLKRRLWEKV